MPEIYWRYTHDVFTNSDPDTTSFVAIDAEREGEDEQEKYIGSVQQFPHGPQEGLWSWSMTVTGPGPRLTFPTNGT